MRRQGRSIRSLRYPFYGALLGLFVLGWFLMIRMPGESFHGTAAPLSPEEEELRADLLRHVQKIGGEIGERNLARYPRLLEAARYVETELTRSGGEIRRHGYDVQGRRCHNLEAEIPGATPEIVLIGAHYDSVFGSPGANDNGSGVAALLALARRFAATKNERTLRFVAFVNEEPHYFQTTQMGSYVYAARCRARRDPIVAMISLETIGYFSHEPGSQKYPAPGLGFLYPRTGDFIGFVGNVASRSLLREAIGEFRRRAQIASEGGALPAIIPGVGWSDQWSFWQHGYPGIMVTDTAPFRYPYYHAASDTPDKIDYDSMTRVVSGMEKVIHHLANPSR